MSTSSRRTSRPTTSSTKATSRRQDLSSSRRIWRRPWPPPADERSGAPPVVAEPRKVHGHPADLWVVAQQRDLVGVDEINLALDPIPCIVRRPHPRTLTGLWIALLWLR